MRKHILMVNGSLVNRFKIRIVVTELGRGELVNRLNATVTESVPIGLTYRMNQSRCWFSRSVILDLARLLRKQMQVRGLWSPFLMEVL